jgi:hypothetical protein
MQNIQWLEWIASNSPNFTFSFEKLKGKINAPKCVGQIQQALLWIFLFNAFPISDLCVCTGFSFFDAGCFILSGSDESWTAGRVRSLHSRREICCLQFQIHILANSKIKRATRKGAN